MTRKRMLYLLVIALTLSQCFILIYFRKTNIDEKLKFSDTDSISKIKNAKSIKEVMNDFSDYSSLTILSYNKIEDGKWKLRCLLKGNNEEIIKDIEKLNCYKIISYSLTYEHKDMLLEVELENK